MRRAHRLREVVIENGIGYDPWVQQILDANGGAGRFGLERREVAGDPRGGNPHQWDSQDAVEKFTARLTSDLAPPSTRRTGPTTSCNERDFRNERSGAVRRTDRGGDASIPGTPIGASESIVVPLAETLGLKC